MQFTYESTLYVLAAIFILQMVNMHLIKRMHTPILFSLDLECFHLNSNSLKHFIYLVAL